MACSVVSSKKSSDCKLLIVSYYWPPLGGPGSLRPVKFAKYLPKFGIEPIVLTRKNIAYHSMDEELIGETKNLTVIKTESLDPARISYIMGLRKYRPKSWHRAIKESINFPDNKLAWLPFAYHAGTKIDYDCIMVTAPPFSAFITGYYLAKKTKKPLILDFRDAWLEFPFMPYRAGLQKWLVSYWEKKITGFASAIIVVDENIKVSLIQKYRALAQKISVISNGYDPDDFPTTKQPDFFTIAYLGTIRAERNPENFLRAVEEFVTQEKISKDAVVVKFIGHIEEPHLTKMKKFSLVKILGHLPYRTALKEFSSAHLGLMITTGSEYFFPSRQNEYLASGLPIVVCGKSKGIHLLEGAFKKGYPGWVYDYGDIKGMTKKIFEIYQLYKNNKLPKGETPFKEYTRENLTKRLADLIKRTKL